MNAMTIINNLVTCGRHVSAVSITKYADTPHYELRITLQDWSSGDGLIAGDNAPIEVLDFERLPDVVRELYIDDAQAEAMIKVVATAGEAPDYACFRRDDYVSWLTKPTLWVKK